jgi:hypothetical protein
MLQRNFSCFSLSCSVFNHFQVIIMLSLILFVCFILVNFYEAYYVVHMMIIMKIVSKHSSFMCEFLFHDLG